MKIANPAEPVNGKYLTVTQFKVEREQEVERMAQVIYKMEKKTQTQEQAAVTFLEADKMRQKFVGEDTIHSKRCNTA